MPKHGKIDCFDPTETNWTSYIERLEYYFAANDIPEDKHKSTFLAVCGSTTFELGKSLVQPDTLADTSFTDILGALKHHYAPEPSPIIQRFKFNSRLRLPGESIPTYIAALRAIGEHCQFGATLNDMIRDRLVCGVNDRAIQRRLLQESKLDYKTAYAIAIAMESASKNTLDLFAGNATSTHVKNLRSGLPSHSRHNTLHRLLLLLLLNRQQVLNRFVTDVVLLDILQQYAGSKMLFAITVERKLTFQKYVTQRRGLKPQLTQQNHSLNLTA